MLFSLPSLASGGLARSAPAPAPASASASAIKLALATLLASSLVTTGLCKDLFTVSAANSRSLSASSLPYFTSKPKTYREKVRDSVTLQCEVHNLGESIVIWKQSNRIISAGEVLIRKDPRLSLKKGFNLKIDDLRESDAGEYVCEIETYGSPMDQTNVLEILVPPSVEPQPSDGKFVVRKGSTITLECSAGGNPKPKITWERANNLLPSGQKTTQGTSIVIQDVTRHHAGSYLCTADNGVGEPATAEIDLKVLFPPEIESNQDWVTTADGTEAEVSCVVHSEPRAEVKWYKDTMLLDPTNHRLMDVYGLKHILTLRNIKETDFGNYSCIADNSLGRRREFVYISGRPQPAKIISAPRSFFKDQYNLTWTVESFLPIDEYRILYRVAAPSYQSPRSHKSFSQYGAPSGDGESNYQTQQQQQQHVDTDWTNIIPTISDNHRPSYQVRNTFTYTGNFVFYGLSHSTDYEVIIQSKNKEGWSDANDIFRFKTRERDYNPLELASHDQQGYSAGQSRSSYTLATLLLAAFFSIHRALQL